MPKNWFEAQRRIHELYIEQHQTLRRVRYLMKANYGFDASTRSYREKLKEWGYLRHDINRQGSDFHQQTSEAGGEGLNSASNMLHSTVGISGVVSDLDLFSNSAHVSLPTLRPPELWTPATIHGDGTHYPIGERYTSYSHARGADSPGLRPLGGQTDGNLNTRDNTGKTHLHKAVISRSLKDVKEYLSLGAAVDIQDDEGNQPLHYAANAGFEEIIQLLLKKGADLNAKGRMGRTPLHMCLRFTKAVRNILKSYPRVSSQDDNGDTPLHLALASSKLKEQPKHTVIERLIRAGADVNAFNTAQITPFHMVLGESRSQGQFHSDLVVMFLENEADIFLRTEDGRLPFEVFVENTKHRWTGYQYYTQPANCNLDLKMFIAKQANIDVTLKSSETLLTEALDKNIARFSYDYELVQLLCNTADINKPGSKGRSPLHVLAEGVPYGPKQRYIECTKVLLRRGANPNQANQAGESPLITLIRTTKSLVVVDVANVLLEGGANPLQRDSKGDIPIYFAARNTEAIVKQKLLELLLDPTWLKQTTSQPAGSEESASMDQVWWGDYHDFLRRRTWSSPVGLLQAANLMPIDVAKLISTTALTIAATKFLEAAKSSFDTLKELRGLHHRDTQGQSNQIVAILRDCRTSNIEIDQSWYHFLLDLFDCSPSVGQGMDTEILRMK